MYNTLCNNVEINVIEFNDAESNYIFIRIARIRMMTIVF